MGKPTAMFGQGLGPLTDKKLEKAAKRVFPLLDVIGLREEVYSKVLALNLGGKPSNIYVTGDDAIEMIFKFQNIVKNSKIFDFSPHS